MKRNTALFGASLAAGALGAVGLVMTSTSSSAAPGDSYAGVAYQITQTGETQGWMTGSFSEGAEGGLLTYFEGSASPGKVTGFSEPYAGPGSQAVSVTTTCVDGVPSVTVTGPAAGTYGPGDELPASEFLGGNVSGTVTFASETIGDYVVGAYLDQSGSGPIGYVALTGANCAAETPTESPTSTETPTESPTTSPTSTESPTESPTSTETPTESPTSTESPTESPTSTSTPTGTPTGTQTPTETPTGTPTGTDSPTSTSTPTEPPTGTPTTTTLPVTG